MNLNENTFETIKAGDLISRSRFKGLSHSWTGTLNTGFAVPIWIYTDVLPGDTFKVGQSFVLRSTTPVAAVMDDAYIDFFYWFVPHKAVLHRRAMTPDTNDGAYSWQQFIGAQDNYLNMPLPTETKIPCFKLAISPYPMSFFDYCGIGCSAAAGTSLSSGGPDISALGYLAYLNVWNNFLRDPNLMQPITYTISGGNVICTGTNPAAAYGSWLTGFSNSNMQVNTYRLPCYCESILPVSRMHGYFGSALPWPQRNAVGVNMALGSTAPLTTGPIYDATNSTYQYIQVGNNGSAGLGGNYLIGATSGNGYLMNSSSTSSLGSTTVDSLNLYADLTSAVNFTVNDLRTNVALQRWYEEMAISGNREDELTYAEFGVRDQMAQDRAIFLGGKRCRIHNTQVAQTAPVSGNGLGTVGAFSLTSDSTSVWTKSFTTWGTIVAIACVRVADKFTQGINKMYTRFYRSDLYWKQMAFLGFQPILQKEIYCTGSTSSDEAVFGYTEAWDDYRHMPSVITSHAKTTAAYWTYANKFSTSPTLQGFLDASKEISNVDQTLQVGSSTAQYQWLLQVEFDVDAVRCIPVHSTPGLLDHF